MTDLIKHEDSSPSLFKNIQAFENGQRIAKALSDSNLVPEAYRGNVPNTMVALEMANRINVSPFMVMQNLHIIKGKPSWSSTFIISALNSCGRFKPLRFRFEGEKKTEDYGCRAVAIDQETGEELKGPLVNWRMVKAEGWLSKGGSKWQTMPELMFQYRAASFFGRLYAPDILTGMHGVEEVVDMSKGNAKEITLENLQEMYLEKSGLLSPDEDTNISRIIQNKEERHYAKAYEFLDSLTETEILGDG